MLQKRMYFLSVLLGEKLGFGPHYYGPYSAAVTSAVSELKSLGFLDESCVGWGTDHRGFEVARYDFFLTQEGQRSADSKIERFSHLWKQIKNAATAIHEAGDLSYMELSIAAKAHFALSVVEKEVTMNEVSQLMRKFGWSVSNDELKKATVFLEQMNLVETPRKKGTNA